MYNFPFSFIEINIFVSYNKLIKYIFLRIEMILAEM